MKNRNCARLTVLALCAGLAPAAMAQVSRTPWQMHQGTEGVIKNLNLEAPGADRAKLLKMFELASIPADGAGWVPAPNPDSIGFGSDSASQIDEAGGTCLKALDYTYFQTLVNVPAGTTVDEFKIIFTGMDDASRITVFNANHPEGLVVDGSYVTKVQATAGTTDLRDLMAAGPNRVVITQVDWCPNGNKLQSARVELNGSVVAAAPPTGALSPMPAQIAAATDEPSATETARVVFISSDGTADFGTRTVFTLTNVATGAATLVPVLGQKSETRTEVYVAPGEYTVDPPPASISDFMTATARDISARRITATAGAPVDVRFSVSTQIAPVVLSADEITPDTVTLSWGVAKQADVRNLVLVRTEGMIAANNPAGGTALDAGNKTNPNVVIRGLAAGRTYSFALFATTSGGQALPPRTLTIETPRADPKAAAFALAPNSIVPTDFASLKAKRVGEHSVRVVLDANKLARGSRSEMPGIDAAQTTSGCVVGAPFLLKTDVAGNESFWGTVDACGTDAAGATTAIINTDVPLSAVFDYYRLTSAPEPACFDAETGRDLSPEACNAPIAAEESGTSQGALGIPRGTDLVRDQRYYNDSRRHYLIWQLDGNLVVYDANDRFVWGLNLYPAVDFAAIGRVSWQADGNLAAYTADGKFIWSAMDVIGGDAALFINEAGTLQIVAGDAVLWSAVAPAPNSQHSAPLDPPSHAPLLTIDAVDAAGARGAAVVEGASDRHVSESRETVQIASPTFHGVPVANPFLAASHGRALPNPLFFLAAKKSKIQCEKSGKTIATLNQNVGPLRKFDIKLSGGKLSWAFQVGVEASIDPQFEAEGGIECGLDLPGKSFQISTYPVPVNLELKPDISVSAQGKLAVRGPKITLKLGIDSNGSASGSLDRCTWFEVPCGVGVKVDHKTKPLASLSKGSVTAVVQGTLTFKAGVEANLGLGVKNTFVTAKAGISMKLAPLSAELKGQAGTSRCVSASMGYQLGADLLAEAYILAFGKTKRVKLWESGHKPYPGAEFTIGNCADI